MTAVLAALSCGAAYAHHSFAMFDMTSEIRLEGVIKSVEWQNPHVWINVSVSKEDGAIEEWGFESGATNTLIRQGWRRDSLKVGERVKIVARPMRNGSHSGSVMSLTFSDGRVFSLGPQGARVPY
jgi:hypothetical protein